MKKRIKSSGQKTMKNKEQAALLYLKRLATTNFTDMNLTIHLPKNP